MGLRYNGKVGGKIPESKHTGYGHAHCVNVIKFVCLHHINNLLQLVEKHHFLGAVCSGPDMKEGFSELHTRWSTSQDGSGESAVFLKKLHNAVRQLGMVRAKGLCFVEG